MRHEFKPGDPALIKQCKTHPPLVGRCVELIQMLPAGASIVFEARPFHNHSSTNAWLVHSAEGFPIHSLAFGLIEFITSPIALFAEHLLMPLRGDDQSDATLATERPAELVGA